MALPTSASTAWMPQRSVVRAMVFTTDQTCGLQVELSTAAAAPSSKWMIRRMLPSAAAQGVHLFEVPYSTANWFVRSKSWKLGQADSAYTTVASVKPQLMQDVLPHPGLEARRIAQFGTLTTAQARIFRVPFSAFVPADNNQKWLMSTAGYLQPNTTAQLTMVAPVVIPPGVTITGISGRFYRTALTDVVTFRFGRLGESGSITALSTMINVGGGIGSWITSTAALTESVTSTKSYVARAIMAASPVASNQRVARFDVLYTRPALDKAY